MLRLFAVLWLFSTASALAQPAVPALTGRVVDLGEILSPTTEAVLTERLAAHEDSTTNQIAVLTVPSLGGAVLEEYATAVFRAWGLGTEEGDNGVLLLVARDDREIRIEVGYGLEGSVTDARAGRIIRDEMTPRFRQGDFDGGVLGAVEVLVAVAEGREAPVTPWRSRVHDPLSRLPPVMTFFTTAALLALAWGFVLIGGSWFWGSLQMGFFFLCVGIFVCFPLLFTSENPAGLLIAVVVACGVVVVNLVLEVLPSTGPRRRKLRRGGAIANARAQRIEREKAALFRAARKAGNATVEYEGETLTVPPVRTSSSSSNSSSSSSSFSGGGGSSGGGGASGGW